MIKHTTNSTLFSSSSSSSLSSTSILAPMTHNYEVLIHNEHQINNDLDNECAIFEGAGNLYDIDVEDNAQQNNNVIPDHHAAPPIHNYEVLIHNEHQINNDFDNELATYMILT